MSRKLSLRLFIMVQAFCLATFGLILKNLEDEFGNLLLKTGILIVTIFGIVFCIKSIKNLSRKKQAFRLK